MQIVYNWRNVQLYSIKYISSLICGFSIAEMQNDFFLFHWKTRNEVKHDGVSSLEMIMCFIDACSEYKKTSTSVASLPMQFTKETMQSI